MKVKFAISALAACVLMSGTAMADGPKGKKQNRSGSVAAGVAAAGPGGAVAGGGAGSTANQPGMTRETRRNGDHRMTRTACIPSSVATTSNNASHIDTKTASGASSTSATGQSSGAVSATSDGGVYAARDRNGTAEVDAYGTSTARARPSQHC